MQLNIKGAGLHSNQVKMLNVVVFLMSLAFFILYPLLANHLISWRKIAVLTVTFIINIRIVVQDLLMLPGSYFLKRASPQAIVACGCITRGIGFLIFSLTDNLALLLIAGILSGIGGALFFPSMHTLYTSYTDESDRLLAFARRERYNSIGAVLGPLLGSALARLGFVWVGVASFLTFVAGSVYMLFFENQNPIEFKNASTATPLKSVVTDSTFMMFAFASMLVMQISNQTSLAIAVRIDQIDPSFPYIGVLSSLSAMMMVLFQIHLLKAMNRKLRKVNILMTSDTFFILGFLLLAASVNTLMVLFASLLFSLGSMLHLPTRDSLLSAYVDGNPSATHYSFIGVFNTFGTLILASTFGRLYDLSYAPAYRYAPWAALVITGVAGAIILLRIADRIEKV